MKVMATRTDLPLGGNRRKADRQRGDRRQRRRLDLVAMALYEQRRDVRDKYGRSWAEALATGRAPFPRRGQT